jgi:hypothetical protein
MLRRVTLVRADGSEELSASFIRMKRNGELGTTLAVTSNTVVPSSSILVTLMMETLSSSETQVITRVTRRNIPQDAIPHVTIILFLRLSGLSHADRYSCPYCGEADQEIWL